MGIGLEGRVAVVTGSAMGIGKAIASTLAQRGADVACWDIAEPALLETVKGIQDAGYRWENQGESRYVKVSSVCVDVTSSIDVDRAAKHTIDGLGDVDILVNVAGGSLGAARGIDDLTEDDWDRVMALNLRAPFLTAKAFAGGMKRRRWGRIVNIASGAGRSYSRSRVIPYAAAKAGLLGFTRQLAVDLAPYGVNMNAVSPGAIASVPNSGWKQMPEAQQQAVLDTVASRRFGESAEIAGAVAFMVSDDASYIVGQTLGVDGGHWMF